MVFAVPYGMSSVDPVVRRPSSASCAARASLSGKVWPTSMLIFPEAIISKSAIALASIPHEGYVMVSFDTKPFEGSPWDAEYDEFLWVNFPDWSKAHEPDTMRVVGMNGKARSAEPDAFQADFMKMIVAVIKPSRLDAVLEAVTEAGASGLTVTEVRGYGRQKGKTEVYRGAEYEVKLLPKVKLEIAVSSDLAETVVEAIARSANTGKIGDGKVFVMDLETALRIRTGERDAEAIAG